MYYCISYFVKLYCILDQIIKKQPLNLGEYKKLLSTTIKNRSDPNNLNALIKVLNAESSN